MVGSESDVDFGRHASASTFLVGVTFLARGGINRKKLLKALLGQLIEINRNFSTYF
jgi:hypothetical protein